MPALSQILMRSHIIEFKSVYSCNVSREVFWEVRGQKRANPNLGKFRKNE